LPLLLSSCVVVLPGTTQQASIYFASAAFFMFCLPGTSQMT
jgi:hypothetical protein